MLAHGLQDVTSQIPNVCDLTIQRDDNGRVDGTPAGPVDGLEVIDKLYNWSGHALDPNTHVPEKGRRVKSERSHA